MGNLFSRGFLGAVVVLFAVSLVVGVVLWLIERRHNEHFGAHRDEAWAQVFGGRQW
jgi:hypothetical protein